MKTIKRVGDGFKSGILSFVSELYENWRGLAIMCLATIGGTVLLTGIGLTNAIAIAGSTAGVWTLCI